MFPARRPLCLLPGTWRGIWPPYLSETISCSKENIGDGDAPVNRGGGFARETGGVALWQTRGGAQLPAEQIFCVFQLSALWAGCHDTAAGSMDVGLGAKLILWVQGPFLPGLGWRWGTCAAKSLLAAPATA